MNLQEVFGLVKSYARATAGGTEGVPNLAARIVQAAAGVGERLAQLGLSEAEILDRIERIAPHNVAEIDARIERKLEELP